MYFLIFDCRSLFDAINELFLHQVANEYFKKLILSSAISLILSPSEMASKRLSGAGATFLSKIYNRWFF
tara:strand:- start:65 stop:271 length:207 start_codon:yes stop_codon:yes gene_type:complete